jgi:hypothetical protein
MFVIYVFIFKEAYREEGAIFREGPIERGSGMRLASSLEREETFQRRERVGGEMSAIYYTER